MGRLGHVNPAQMSPHGGRLMLILKIGVLAAIAISCTALAISAIPTEPTPQAERIPEAEPAPGCLPSYPEFCIAPGQPDLDCDQIGYRNFAVVGSDPHRFDGDKDGIGCESRTPTEPTPQAERIPEAEPAPGCLPSYPEFCIAPGQPDLDCADIGYRNFAVIGADPHRFDGDKDGIGCESR